MLRGLTGKEMVMIVDGNFEKNVTLNGKSQLFTAKTNNITIIFTNDNGANDVYFGSAMYDISTSITAPYLFEKWGCDVNAKREDGRCKIVRKGHFNWSGTYIVIFKGNQFLLHQIMQ